MKKEYDYVVIGSSPQAFGFLMGLEGIFTAIILERGHRETNEYFGDAYYNTKNVIVKRDVSGKYIFESNLVGGSELLEEGEVLWSDRVINTEGIYNLENLERAKTENIELYLNINKHIKTVIYEDVKYAYDETDDHFVDYVESYVTPKRKDSSKTKKKFTFYNTINECEHIKLLEGCNVEKILLDKDEEELYTGRSVICNYGAEKIEISAKKDIIIAIGTLSTCKLLYNSGIFRDGEFINNENIGNNIQSEIEINTYYYAKNNDMSIHQEIKNNPLYYRLYYIINNPLFIALFGLFFSWLFIYMWAIYTPENRNTINIIYSLCGIVDGFIVSFMGFKFLWLLSYAIGTYAAALFFTFKGFFTTGKPTFTLYYWIFHILSSFVTNYYFSSTHINWGNESLTALIISSKDHIQKITNLKNLDYKFLRIYFVNTYESIVKFIFYVNYIFGLRYFLFSKIIQVKTISRNFGVGGKWSMENGKEVIDLNLGEIEDRMMVEIVKENEDIMKKTNLIKIPPYNNLDIDYVQDNSYIHHCISGSCVMGEDPSDSVVDKNNGLLLFGSNNIRIIGAASWPHVVDSSSSMFFYLTAYITAKAINK